MSANPNTTLDTAKAFQAVAQLRQTELNASLDFIEKFYKRQAIVRDPSYSRMTLEAYNILFHHGRV